MLRQKYPDTKAKGRIEQDGLKVTMIIETPEGELESLKQSKKPWTNTA